ncbi:MAG: hypothetical protein AB4426_12475 [Xenococcaceae cyanobacterium]
MTQISNISDQPQPDENKDLLVKIFNRLLTLEEQIKQVRVAQEETNKKVSAWDVRLWVLSLILIGAAMTAFITITLSVGSLAFKVLLQ